MRAADPFEGFELDLSYRQRRDQPVEVSLDGEGLPDDERQLRLLAYAGMFDLLVEALMEACETDEERDGRLSWILGKLQSAEPIVRFNLFENSQLAKDLELISRMRGKDIVMTREWLLPKLDRDMGVYRRRIEALDAALEGDDR